MTGFAFAKVLAVFPAGGRLSTQPSAMGAPEVFLGQLCTEKSQVWAVAATLLCWIKPGILGACPYPWIDEAWCMAKIMRLFLGWEISTPDKLERETLRVALNTAVKIKEEEDFNAISPLEEELKKVEMPQELRDLVRFMFITGPPRVTSKHITAISTFVAFSARAWLDFSVSVQNHRAYLQ